MKIKFTVIDILIVLLSFLIMLSHTMYTYTDWNTFNYGLKILLSIMPLCILMISKYKMEYRMAVRMQNMLFAYTFLAVLYFVIDVNGSAKGSYIFRFLIFVPLMMVVFCCVDYKKILCAYENIIVYVALVEFIMWLLFTVMDIGNPTNQIYIAKWGKCYRDCYYGIYFEIPASTLNIPFYRNTGIYAEAPAFAFNLCIALLIEVYLVENKSAKKTIILIASMLSTVSTTAFLILIYICVTKVWEHLKSKKNVRYIKWILIAIVVVIGMGVLYTLATGRGKAGSLLLRSQDYVNGFNAFLKSPLIGYGYQLDTSVFVTGYSNSISVVLTNGGILLFMIYFMPLIISVFINKNIRKDYMYWYIAVIILLLICAVTYTYLVLTIISAGYATIIRSKYRHEYSFDGSNPQGKLRNKCSRI